MPTPSTGGTRGRAGLYAAFAAYLAVTLIQLLPLLRDLLHQLPSDPGDPVLNTWILWWNAHAWPLTTSWWDAPAFYPAPGALSFSEHLVGLTPLTTPIQWLSGSPELAYNVAFIVSFPLSAIAMHLLVRELTGRDDVAFVAGAAFGFSPYRVAQLAHLQVLFSFWMPLALLGLHKGLRGRRWGFPFAAACWLMQGLANGYLLLFFPIVAGLWLVWFMARQPRALATAPGPVRGGRGLVTLPFLIGVPAFPHAVQHDPPAVGGRVLQLRRRGDPREQLPAEAVGENPEAVAGGRSVSRLRDPRPRRRGPRVDALDDALLGRRVPERRAGTRPPVSLVRRRRGRRLERARARVVAERRVPHQPRRHVDSRRQPEQAVQVSCWPPRS